MKVFLLIMYLISNVQVTDTPKENKEIQTQPTIVQVQVKTVQDPVDATFVLVNMNRQISTTSDIWIGKLYEISISTNLPTINEIQIPKLIVK